MDFAGAEEMSLGLRRTYNHYWGNYGIFGRHWISNFDYSLSGSTTKWAQRPDGRRIKFVAAGSNRWDEDKAEPIAFILKNSDGSFTLYAENQNIEAYNANGYIKTLKNRQNIGWTFTYGGLNGNQLLKVTHTNGRHVDLTWTGTQLTQVKDPAGNVYSYAYYANRFGTNKHLLKTATLPGSTTITYHYEDSRFLGALTGKSYNGVRYSTFAYDAEGRATLSEHAGGAERHTYSYTVANPEPPPPPPPEPPPPGGECPPGEPCTHPKGVEVPVEYAVAPASAMSSTSDMTVVETNPLGKKTTYTFVDGKLTEVTGQASANCAASYKERSYDANGYENLVFDFEDGLIDYDYSPKGQLTRKREQQIDSDGDIITLRTTTYEWHDTADLLLKETVAGDRETSYTYTSDGKRRLTSVKIKNLSINGVPNQVHTTTYTYTTHASGLVYTMVVDGPLSGSGDAITYTYYGTGDLAEVKNSLGHKTTYANYNALGLPGRVTGPNGAITDYVYDARGRVTQEKRSINGAWQITEYTYDTFGRLLRVTTPDGHARERQYDAAWRVASEYEPEAGGTWAETKYAYNAMSLPTQTTAQRDSSMPVGNAQFVSQSVPTSMTVGHAYTITVKMKNTGTSTWTSADGFRLAAEPWSPVTWGVQAVGLGSNGAVGPNQTATFTFNVTAPNTAGSYGMQWKMRRYGYATFGQVTPNVAVTVTPGNVPPTADFSFTTDRRTANFTDGSSDSDGSIAQRSWNFGDGGSSSATNPSHTYAVAGTYNVTLTVTDDDGATDSKTRAVTVDGGGGGCPDCCPPPPNQCQDPQPEGLNPVEAVGPEEEAALPPEAGIGEPSAPLGVRFTAFTVYDELGRVIERRRSDGSTAALYTYDHENRVKTIKDGLGHTTTLYYDALGRVVTSKDPNNKLTTFTYDAGDRITQVTDPLGRHTTYVYDGFGQLWKQTSPDSGVTNSAYDSTGRRTSMTRADGTVTAYTHDALGRVVSASADDRTQSFTYDDCSNGLGRLCEADDGYIGRTVLAYTPQGQVASQRPYTGPSSPNLTHSYTYDGQGRLASLTYPNGQRVNYTYAAGRLSSVKLTVGVDTYTLASGYGYEPTGAVSQWTYNNGLIRRQDYDLDGRLIGIGTPGVSGIQQIGYGYDGADRIEAQTNHVVTSMSQSFSYDALSRLSGYQVASGPEYALALDSNGNRLQMTRTDGVPVTTTHAYASGRNQLTATRTGDEDQVSRRYDPNGNTTAIGTASYEYDPFGRLLRATKDGVTTTYWVNALGQRVYKTQGAPAAAYYVYGAGNTLLAEYSGFVGGTWQWRNYIYANGQLLALTDGNAKRMVHTDHLGRPDTVTDVSKQVNWRANNYPFTRSLRTNDLGGLGSLNLGLPGQYYDAETGHWHNGFRDYDADTGRYLQSDPIGLAGGINTYAYVGGDPIARIDPLGLESNPFGGGLTQNDMLFLGQKEKAQCDWDEAGEEAGKKLAPTAKCLAGKMAANVGWEVAAYAAVAVGSEFAGPEVGVPATLLYRTWRGSALKNALGTVATARDIAECIDAAE